MKIINIEGIDAVGKETVSKALEKTLYSKGFRVKRVEFPNYDGNFGRAIKDVLMGKCGNAPELHHELISPLYTLDRIEYFKKNIKSLFDNYDYVICDRSFYSNFMYQASKIYMDNSIFYSQSGIISALYKWMLKNGQWEFSDTGLCHCENIQTFVLSLSEEDSLKQLNNRKEKDTNETNRGYLSECKKFIKHMMSDDVREAVKAIISGSSKSDATVLQNYIMNVHSIKVQHTDDKDKIPYYTMNVVNHICQHLSIPINTASISQKVPVNKKNKMIGIEYLDNIMALRELFAEMHVRFSHYKMNKVELVFGKNDKKPISFRYFKPNGKSIPVLLYDYKFDSILDKPFPCAVKFIYTPYEKKKFRMEELKESTDEN